MLLYAGLGEKKITVNNADGCSLQQLINILKTEFPNLGDVVDLSFFVACLKQGFGTC